MLFPFCFIFIFYSPCPFHLGMPGFASKESGKVDVCFLPCRMLPFYTFWIKRSSWVNQILHAALINVFYCELNKLLYLLILSERDKHCNSTGYSRGAPLFCIPMKRFLLILTRYIFVSRTKFLNL